MSTVSKIVGKARIAVNKTYRQKERTMLKHYVELFYPGTIVANTKVLSVKTRTSFDATELSANCYAYRFFDVSELSVNGELLKGERKNYSSMTYFGRVMTLQDVEAEYPEATILINNMKRNRLDKIVRSRTGNFDTVGENDSVVSGM